MPSKNMLPKGKRRHSVKAEYRKLRTELEEQNAAEAARRAELSLPDPEDGVEEDGDDDFYDVAEMMAEELPDPRNPYLRITNPIGTRNEMHATDERRYAGLQATALRAAGKAAPVILPVEGLAAENGVRTVIAPEQARDLRLDAYLAKAIADISRVRVQLLIDHGQVTVNGAVAKPKHKLKPGERIEISGEPQLEPLRAEPEDIPLTIVYEDSDLAAVDKPAGMSVHAGAGSAAHNSGTLVNALLHHFGADLARGHEMAGEPVRPGIVHRLDKDTSGLILIAKNDSTHRKLAEMFAAHSLRKVYRALVHGHVRNDQGTIELAISRDPNRRVRMTTRRSPNDHARSAVSHYTVVERMHTPFGPFTLVEVRIETGRTHQIRVHMQAIGHAVVGDTTYGAPAVLRPAAPRPGTVKPGAAVMRPGASQPGTVKPGAAVMKPGAPKPGASQPEEFLDVEPIEPERQFLHAAELDFAHPQTGKPLELRSALPADLVSLLDRIRGR